MRSPRFQPEEIFKLLVEHEVEFVVIGGIAATLYGSHLRTGDLDVCPSRDSENLDRLSLALRQLEARIRTAGAPQGLPLSIEAHLLAQVELLDLTTRFGDFDLAFEPVGTGGYPDLRQRQVEFDLERLVVPVASLEDVIRSKEAAGRRKDKEQLPVLKALLQEIRVGSPW